MSIPSELGGTFTLKGINKTIHRMGYGALQLTGPMAWGEPADHNSAVNVVREVVKAGINHIDTSDYYGPHIANKIIREAIHPYPQDLLLVTKVGARRGEDRSWPAALSEKELTSAVEDNLNHLGLDALEVVNLRLGEPRSTNEDSLAEPLRILVKLKEQGLIRGIGLSNISHKQFKESEDITDIVCVQNHYNLVHRYDDALIDELSDKGIAFVPFFPLGGFRPIQSTTIEALAASFDTTPKQIALAWLLQRSPNILVIAGTSSVKHLHENVAAASLQLSSKVFDELNQLHQAKG
jgi:pyridoxine 4-dehydrogenase